MGTNWQFLLLLAGLMVAVWIFLLYRIGLRQRAETERFKKLPPTEANLFLRGCGIEAGTRQSNVALRVRRILGEMSDVPPESLHAEDRFFVELRNLPPWDCLDTVDFVMRLEEAFGIHISDNAGEIIGKSINSQDATVRDLIVAVIKVIELSPEG